MDRVDAVTGRDIDDRGNVQIRTYRLAALGRADQERLVRLEAMQREPILEAVDGDRLQPELGCRAKTADRDFRAVDNQQLLHRRRSTTAAA
jgi:hypothetical protein